jgi:beta-N-acetylhexosaminidase
VPYAGACKEPETQEMDHLQRAGRRLWIGIPGTRLDAATRAHLEDLRPGGVVLFRRNVGGRAEVRALIRELRDVCGNDLVVSADQEHGLVNRFDKEIPVFPGNMALGATGVREVSMAEHLALDQGRHSGAALADLGIDVNLAPVCDLACDGGNPGLGTRAFGAWAPLAAPLVAALSRGLVEGGVHATLKHFPGLGRASLDTHHDLPTVMQADLTEALAPFLAGMKGGARCVMTTHVVFPELDAEFPATFSKRIIGDLLRARCRFDGVVVTDDLEMGAMTARFGFDDVIRGAVRSGHDALCICLDADRQRRARDLLAEGLASNADWIADPAASERRLAALRRPAGGFPLDDAAAEALADAIAGRAVTVARDPSKLLPLAADEPVLAVVPALRGETMAEDPLRGETLDTLLAGLPVGSKVFQLPPNPDMSVADAVAAAAAPYRRVVLGTTLARFDAAHRRFAQRVATSHTGVVVVALRNPFDFELLPPSITCVTAYGFRPVHQRALLKVLFGRVAPYGRLPVTLVDRSAEAT